MDVGTDRRIDTGTEGMKDGQMRYYDERMNGWVEGGERMEGQIEGLGGWTDVMYGRMNGWIDGWTDRS